MNKNKPAATMSYGKSAIPKEIRELPEVERRLIVKYSGKIDELEISATNKRITRLTLKDGQIIIGK